MSLVAGIEVVDVIVLVVVIIVVGVVAVVGVNVEGVIHIFVLVIRLLLENLHEVHDGTLV